MRILNDERTGFITDGETRLFHSMKSEELGEALWSLENNSGHIADINFTGCDFSAAEINSMQFDGCCFNRTQFPQVIHRTKFDNCHFRFVKFESGTFLGVDFKKCDLWNTEFHDIKLYEVMFRMCDMNYCILNKCDVRGTHFVQCQIGLSDFIHTTLAKARFYLCDVNNTNFNTSVLQNSRFESCSVQNSTDIPGLQDCTLTKTMVEMSNHNDFQDGALNAITISRNNDYMINATLQSDGTVLLSIGCQSHPLETWVVRGESIAKDHCVDFVREQKFRKCVEFIRTLMFE